MKIKYQEIEIRDAVPSDAPQFCSWWNDGSVMAHAGFPLGVGITVEAVTAQLCQTNTGSYPHMILYQSRPIGEMGYGDLGNGICEIGIKICDASMQNRGLGKRILSLFITELFDTLQFEKVILDTNLHNKRAQHVYESLGFEKVGVRENAFIDQLGMHRPLWIMP